MRNPWIPDPYGEEEEHLHPDLQFTWQERLKMAWQAMKGALLIGAVYLVVFAAIIALMLFFWK